MFLHSSTRNNVADWNTHTGFYTEKSLHRGAFYTQKVLHRVVFPLRSFCTQTSWSFYTQKLLHKEVFTALTHRHRNSYTEKPLHREWLHTEAFTHREIFTQTRFHTEKLLHKEDFTQRNFYTRKLLHTKAFTQRSLCTAAPLREVTSWNWQQFVRKNFRRSFRELTCSQKKRLFPTNMFQKTYISAAGPHSLAFKSTLRWNGGPSGGPSSPAEPERQLKNSATPAPYEWLALRASQTTRALWWGAPQAADPRTPGHEKHQKSFTLLGESFLDGIRVAQKRLQEHNPAPPFWGYLKSGKKCRFDTFSDDF